MSKFPRLAFFAAISMGFCAPWAIAQDKSPDQLSESGQPRFIEGGGQEEPGTEAVTVTSVPASAFHNANTNDSNSDRIWFDPSSGSLRGFRPVMGGPRDAEEYATAPLNLPQGRTIRGATAYIRDSYGGADVFTSVSRIEKATGVVEGVIGSVDAGGNSTAVQRIVVNINGSRIDNTRYAYYIVVRMFHRDQHIVGYDVRHE